MPTHGEAEAIIAMWREIERALESAEAGSPEFERLTADAALLRDEYQRVMRDVSAVPDAAVAERA